MELKNEFSEYTELEFLKLIEVIYHAQVSSESEHDRLVEHFEKITEYPDGYGVIYYPKGSQDDSPEGVLKEVKQWRAANGKPGFRKH